MKTGPILGFTGSRKGLTLRQSRTLKEWLFRLHPREAHHGDCVGADFEFNRICYQLNPRPRLVSHPPDDSRYRAFCQADETRRAVDYLERDDDIARECEFLIATPFEKEERLRSGTWATVRYARSYEKPVLLIFPNGSVKQERFAPEEKNTNETSG